MPLYIFIEVYLEHNELLHAYLYGVCLMKKICDIKTRNELADFLKIPRQKFTQILYSIYPNNCYTTFKIPKKKGGTRSISAPNDELKEIQCRIVKALSDYQQTLLEDNHVVNNISHAFERGKSIISNAKVHRNKRLVLNVDLKDFFDSFHFGRVCGYFEKNKYFMLPHEVAVILAQLSCYEGKLPQGAPTSPIITNLMCSILDAKIINLSKKYKLRYTRYADDLTFSTNNRQFIDKYNEFVERLEKIINYEGFEINKEKTRLQYNDSRQVVTGLVVNEKINICRDYYKETRAMANNLYNNGEFAINGITGTINQLEGRFSFIDQIEKHNNVQDKENHSFYKLNGREKQFQKFLFYKYFFAGSKPIIITEGKTDIIYLKAALRKLYKEYPDLVEKKKDGSFEYKISFLKRTSKIRYFFGIAKDGADAIKNVTRFFTDSKNFTNYYKYFKEVTNNDSAYPTIIIFDNELSNKEKPLSKFANEFVNKENKELLKKDLKIQVFSDTNLFLITNQLIDGKEESEIEDLFDKATLETIIDGRKLILKDKYDTKQFYGKEIFSKYVINNYEKIDFSNFRCILDNIVSIIKK